MLLHMRVLNIGPLSSTIRYSKHHQYASHTSSRIPTASYSNPLITALTFFGGDTTRNWIWNKTAQ